MSDRFDLEYDVVIAGGGLVGLGLGCALVGSGLRIAIVDEQAADAEMVASDGYDVRVAALTPDTTAWFADLGVWQGIESERFGVFDRVRVWDGVGTSAISFAAAELGIEHLGHIVENRVARRAMRARLEQEGNVELVAPDSVVSFENGASCELTLASGRRMAASLLVGADGALSTVRELSGFKTVEWDYGHSALVSTVRTASKHDFRALHRFSVSGPLAFLPLPGAGGDENSHYWSIVWCQAPSRIDELMAMKDADFRGQLAREFDGVLGAVEEVSQRAAFPLRQRHVVGYVRERVALIGDAAHTIHPLAGQGVNIGYRDARALGDVIREAAAEEKPLGDLGTLRRFERRRVVPNVSMTLLMEGFKQLFSWQGPGITWLRNAGVRQLDRHGIVKNEIVRLVLGV